MHFTFLFSFLTSFYGEVYLNRALENKAYMGLPFLFFEQFDIVVDVLLLYLFFAVRMVHKRLERFYFCDFNVSI